MNNKNLLIYYFFVIICLFFIFLMYSLGELRVGHVVNIDDTPFLVTYCQHSKQARGAGVLKTTLKNLKTGTSIPKTFQGNEKLEPADVGYFKAQYLYKNGENYEFMRNDTYEQFFIQSDIIEEKSYFLVEGLEYDVQYFEENPISILLPKTMQFTVKETVPGVKGDTAQGGTKPATLDNGLVVQVPLFVNESDIIQINTDTKEFQKRIQN